MRETRSPIENRLELGSSRLFVAHAIASRYRAEYEALFGALPALSDAARFPRAGRPGDPAFDAMAPPDRDAVTRVLANVGKAIAAFERTMRVRSNALDAYAAGDRDALRPTEKRGLRAFFTAGCAQCHYGPRLTDDAFHALRFPSGRRDGSPDVGRAAALDLLRASEFRGDGPLSDAPAAARAIALLAPLAPTMVGAFKTPTLRGIDVTAPFGHGGNLATLDELLLVYAASGLSSADARAAGVVEPWLPPLSDEERADLGAFLATLRGEAYLVGN